MVTDASNPAAGAHRAAAAYGSKEQAAPAAVFGSLRAFGHLSGPPASRRMEYLGIGTLVCTISSTPEPGVLRSLLNAIMGLDADESDVAQPSVRALQADGITL
jgi:hypothetical protein